MDLPTYLRKSGVGVWPTASGSIKVKASTERFAVTTNA